MKWWLETLRIRVDCGSKIIKNNSNTTWRQKRKLTSLCDVFPNITQKIKIMEAELGGTEHPDSGYSNFLI